MKHKWLLILIAAVAAVIFFFFFRMYRDDIKALRGFMASYERFDKAVSDFPLSGSGDTESKASEAVADLAARASLRLSSLIKNDAQLMGQALDVADLARREIESLRVYKNGIQNENADVDELAEGSRVLSAKRKAAYARFQELGGVR